MAPPVRATLFAIILTLLQACSDHTERTVGFLGPLEGKYSDLGVQGRNGAQLALEEANAQGTIPGTSFRLVAADDKNTPEGAELAMSELAASHPVAVIGPMTSGVALAALKKATESNIPLVSPTVSSPVLTGKKDLFFRVLGDSPLWARILARFVAERRNIHTVVLLTDMDNETFSGPYRDAFGSEFTRLGGRVLRQIDVHSSSMDSWNGLAREIESMHPDALFITLSARDASMLAKTFTQRTQNIDVYSSMWAATHKLVEDCGHNCNDWTFGMGYSEDNPRSEHVSFRQRYQQRFGVVPNFAAVLSYEAAQFFLQGMVKAAGDPRDLVDAMSSLPSLPGVAGSFQVNEFGDVVRDSYIVTFNGTDFHTHETIR